MLTVAVLQASWFDAVLSIWTEMPDHEPTPLPLATDAPTLAGEPLTWKLLASQAAPADVPVTVAVTALTKTGPVLGLSNVPLSAWAGPPGYKPVTELVWLTVRLDVVPTAAEPEPEPACVQYA